MTNLVDVSPEILHNLFTFVDPPDLGRLSRSCRFLKDFIFRDELLWRKLYMDRFDEPKVCPKSWAAALQEIVRLEKILGSSNYDMKRSQLNFVAGTTLSLLLSVKPGNASRNKDFLNRYFVHDSRRSNVTTFMRQSSLFRRCGLPYDEPADSFELQQLSAKLHVHFGLEAEVRPSELMEVDGALEIHPYARSRVYDLRRYKAANRWGPFMDDGSGRVDWEKIQAVFIVLAHGLSYLCEKTSGAIGPVWDSPFNGVSANSYQSAISSSDSDEEEHDPRQPSNGASIGLPTPPSSLGNTGPLGEWLQSVIRDRSEPYSREAAFRAEQEAFALQDPYGVKGTWMRIVNFLDYHDLFAFNFTGPAPAGEIEREPVTNAEAHRLILIKLWVTRIEYPDANDEDGTIDGEATAMATEIPTGSTGSGNTVEIKHKKMPTVHFAGKSRSLHIRWDPNANSHIRGTVRMTPHGDVRWTTFSVFHGEERWRSECVQIGGIKSQRGALGNWFDKDYDPHGPAGPTAFWKIHDGFDVFRNDMEED